MNKNVVGSTCLLLIGILFGLSGVIAKYLSTWLNPYQVVEYRFFVAFVLALILLIVTKQRISFKSLDIKTLAVFAITFPLSVIFFTLAIFNTSVSLAVFSFYISTLAFSFIVGRLFFGELITFNKKIALVIILLAVIAFTNPFEGFNIQIGFVYGVISGLFQTIASAFQKIAGKTTNRLGLLIIQTLAGFGISSFVLLIQGESLLPILPLNAVFITIFFGIIFLIISYLFLVGFKYINLNVGSILVSSELFFGPFFAYLFLKENLSSLELLGGVLIVIAVLFSNKRETSHSHNSVD